MGLSTALLLVCLTNIHIQPGVRSIQLRRVDMEVPVAMGAMEVDMEVQEGVELVIPAVDTAALMAVVMEALDMVAPDMVLCTTHLLMEVMAQVMAVVMALDTAVAMAQVMVPAMDRPAMDQLATAQLDMDQLAMGQLDMEVTAAVDTEVMANQDMEATEPLDTVDMAKNRRQKYL
uniref:Uncharacterized protein n=1 Tax=Ditylenchus dipsaci TaxID=166011 RepID=A0A915DWJ1_9BILA